MKNSIKKSPYSFFLARSIFHLIVLVALAFFSEQSSVMSSSLGIENIFLIYGLSSTLQLLSIFIPLKNYSIFVLLLIDIACAMILLRLSGGSSSPFLAVYPCLAFFSSLVFRKKILSYICFALTLCAIPAAVGFGPSILSIALVTTALFFVGMYLSQKLFESDTKLSLAKREGKRLKNLQKAIMSNIPSALISVNTEGKLIQINKVALKLLGWKQEEVLSKKLQELIPEIEPLRAQLETVTSINDFDAALKDRHFLNYKKETSDLKLSYALARLSDPEDKSPIGTLIVLQDLSDMLNMKEELHQSEKLAAVGKLAAGIAHEIRNPLASISGAAQLFEGSTHLETEDKKLLSIIQKESARLDFLITDFLEYVRPQEPKQNKINLKALINDVIDSLSVNPKWLESGSVAQIIEKGSSESFALGDHDKIIQVILNMMLNSSQAGAKNVFLHIEDGHRLSVADDGPGIPDEMKKNIFEPFFTTKQSGTGLGLAISYRALEDMDAQVEVESPAEEFVHSGGTVFKIRFKEAA